MCLSPRHIYVDLQGNSKPCKSILWNRLVKDVRYLLRPYHFSDIVVPCGKCFECLKDRSNDLAIRAYLAAKKYGSMHFVTLTYSQDHLPLTARLCIVDKSTGDVFHDANFKFVSERCTKIAEMRKYFYSNKSSKPRYFYVDDIRNSSTAYCDSDFDYYVKVTPSLDRRDVRLWIKRARVKYERIYHKKFSEFKKICIGEFGPKTCRPHYHLAFFGLSNDEINFLLNEWKYGYKDLKVVKAVNKDGSNGWLAAAKYIGKYISKGSFECQSVIDGDAEKPRLFCSCNLFELTDSQISYYRCYDLFGYYDINSLFCVKSNSYFTFYDLQKLHTEALKRSKINLNGFQYKLPRSLIKKIWYTKDEIDKTFKASFVRVALTSFVQHDLVDDFIAEFLKSRPEAERLQVLQAIEQFKSNDAYVKESVYNNLSKDFYKQFSQSKF